MIGTFALLWTVALCFAPVYGIALFGWEAFSALTLLCADLIILAGLNYCHHLAATTPKYAQPVAILPISAGIVLGLAALVVAWLDPFGGTIGFHEIATPSSLGASVLLMAVVRLGTFAVFLLTPEARRAPPRFLHPLLGLAVVLWVVKPDAPSVFAAVWLICLAHAGLELFLSETHAREHHEGGWMRRVHDRLARGD